LSIFFSVIKVEASFSSLDEKQLGLISRETLLLFFLPRIVTELTSDADFSS